MQGQALIGGFSLRSQDTTMTCKNNDIKELFPAYLERTLDETDRERIETHLASCEDCRTELALLQTMSEEPVPDPGEAFWTALPNNVYRAMQDQRSKKKMFDLSWIADRLVLPRWTWTAAAAAIVLLVSWFVINPLHRQGNDHVFGDEYDYSYGSIHDPNLTHPAMNMSDLSAAQLDSVDTGVGQELSTMAFEAESVMLADSDPSEELAELDHHEIERLSDLLNEYEEEV
jgi:predicted anti-sigma-YlaC factor YlaD